jgi:hypothetical protein
VVNSCRDIVACGFRSLTVIFGEGVLESVLLIGLRGYVDVEKVPKERLWPTCAGGSGKVFLGSEEECIMFSAILDGNESTRAASKFTPKNSSSSSALNSLASQVLYSDMLSPGVLPML